LATLFVVSGGEPAERVLPHIVNGSKKHDGNQFPGVPGLGGGAFCRENMSWGVLFSGSGTTSILGGRAHQVEMMER